MQEQADSPEDVLHMLLEHGGASFYDRLREELDKHTFIGGKRVAKQKLTPLEAKASGTVHVVKVSLHDAKPPVWRRLEVPSAMTLDRMHEVLQVAFEWEDCHLHQFETVCGEFGNPAQAADWSELSDESAVALAQVARAERAKAVYLYDFGDDWRHDIVVEKIIPAVPGVAYPRCTGGKGAVPEEDSGGIWIFNDERAEAGGPAGGFDPGQATGALAGLAQVIVPRTLSASSTGCGQLGRSRNRAAARCSREGRRHQNRMVQIPARSAVYLSCPGNYTTMLGRHVHGRPDRDQNADDLQQLQVLRGGPELGHDLIMAAVAGR